MIIMYTNKNVNGKCRLCLVDHDKTDLTPVFNDSDVSGLSLAARIMICLSLPVQASDSFPNTVCRTCRDHVTQFYAFREICYNSYYSLLKGYTLFKSDSYCVPANNDNDEEQNQQSIENNAEIYDEVEDAEFHCTRLTQTDPDSQEKIAEHEILCAELNSQSNDGSEKISLEGVRSEYKTMKISVENVCVEEIASAKIESDTKLDNVEYESNNEVEEKGCYDEKSQDESQSVEDVEDSVKYKCLRCNNLFADLDTASAHCEECSHMDHGEKDMLAEQTENVMYLEENFDEPTEHDEQVKNIDEETIRCCDGMNSSVKVVCNEATNKVNITKESNVQWKDTFPCLRSPSTVRKQKNRENKSTNHSCSDCESIFSSATLLRRHSVVHTGERPFECEICNKRFSRLGQLNFHKNFHENPRYRCSVCEKPFLRPSDIQKHMRTHTGEKPYDCRICAKSFAQLVSLQQHERIHTGDKPFVCEICGKRFSQKANKTKHVKIHKEGAKPHTCEICGRSFSDPDEMNLHRAGHGGGKPRKCNYCDESFRKMSELSQHIRRYHTFERPHKCAFCQKAFYSLYNLKQHVMVHTGQKPYACTHCDLKFTQKGNLTKHFERKHADPPLNKTDCPENKDDECESEKDETMLILTEELEEDVTDSLVIEREETVQVETCNDNIVDSNIQIYEMSE